MMRVIDGTLGEGGGQILRTALALSLVTGIPFRMEQIRGNRKNPGLRQQHVTAVNAATQVGRAEVQGNTLGSSSLTFTPQGVHPGHYHFAVGTAGSCTLVLQTILPALMTASEPSDIVLEGGTHNPFAPTFDFLAYAFLPILMRMGPTIAIRLDRPGFYPAGGGKVRVTVTPTAVLTPIDLLTRGAIVKCSAIALLANLPRHIGERELKVVHQTLAWPSHDLVLEEVKHIRGPGNALTLIVTSEHITEVFTGFGERGLPAERVASRVVTEVQEYLEADVPVGWHLADQLLIPFALAGGGTFRTLHLTQHTLTNLDVIKQFLPVEVSIQQLSPHVSEIRLCSPQNQTSPS